MRGPRRREGAGDAAEPFARPEHVAGRGAADSGDDFVSAGVLHQVTGGAEGDGAGDVGGVVVRAEHHDGAAGKFGAELAEDAEAVDAGHSDVEQNDVGAVTAGEAERFVAVGGVAQDLDVADVRQQTAQAGANDHVVVSD